MRKKTAVLDTNVFIRYFTKDTPKQAKAVEQLFRTAKFAEFELPDVAIAEIVWVLLSFYKLSKEEVIEKIEGILSLEQLKLNRNVIEKTVAIWRTNNISYIDAYLVAYSICVGNKKLYTFDKRLNKLKEIDVVEPRMNSI